jgi:NAD(P)-dependent dehydrogenase (short-subunit alcohol dehydrogenase family)
MDFSGQLVVITGVGRAGQLGEALALEFAQRGATLVLVDRLAAEAEARAADLVNAGFSASAHAADLTDDESTRKLVEAIAQLHGDRFSEGVNAVICAAGGFASTGPLDSTSRDDWQRMFAINVETAYCTTRAFLPAVRQARGAFVYYGSVAALPGGSGKGMAAYTAAKSGVLALMRAVAADERKHGVRANAVAPTAIRTAENLSSMGADKDYVDRESVAEVTAFLASSLARNISGQVIQLA